ncbi:MAG TPA: SAVED domain-containing protein [Thermoanaerobaculia bacterium]|jgi:hypothetical protein|nr:SAVED domain-containing protein [Thermoanaerobaculia bacterium]
MPGSPAGIDLLGPIFISYRTLDGEELAERMAWALRSAGVPVWHDQADMPPGSTETRLREALARGLSGAVLVVTPEIKDSAIVKNVEAPEFLRLHEADPDFILVVASNLERTDQPGHLDLDAPDRLLSLPAGTLRSMKQYPLFIPEACEKIAERVVRRRMDCYRRLGEETLTIDLQTRLAPQAFTNQTALVVRTPPPKQGTRAPSPEIWPPLRSFLAAVPALVDASGAKRIVVKGGAHLSAAFAVGAAFPTTSGWPLVVEDQFKVVWEKKSAKPAADLFAEENSFGVPREPVIVLVDLVPTSPPTDAFGDFLKATSTKYSASLKLRLSEPRMLVPEELGATTARIADRVRDFASQHDTNEVHLFLRTSFPSAVFLGRLFNTLRVTLYELEERDGRPYYLGTVAVSPGQGGGPIVAVL